ncbi:MAG: GGDEF domain-containing protein [Emcibacteraceae bacterium]|nr:GGDEF domain-containing protein [Emcibacteraceae bacterium]
MNVIQYNQGLNLDHSTFKVSEKASELVKKFHQSTDGLTLKNWKALSEILDYAAAAEQTIADQKAYITNLESMASTDILTGLLNKQGFEQEINHAIARAKRFGEKSLFAYIDLDSFKVLNDTYGHNAGDAMLLEIATLLASSIRKTDAAARLHGDEFGLLLSKCDIEKAKERAGYIRHLLKKVNLHHDDNELHTSASMGFAVIDGDTTIEEIFQTADQAMYDNKRTRKNTRNKYHLT